MTAVLPTRRSTHLDPIPLTKIPDLAIREEWEHLRLYKIDDQTIALRLGIEWAAVVEWSRRDSRTVRSAEARRLIEAGLTNQQVAVEVGMRADNVRRIRGSMGLGQRGRRDDTLARRERVTVLVRAGYSTREIADQVGARIDQIRNDRKILRQQRLIEVPA